MKTKKIISLICAAAYSLSFNPLAQAQSVAEGNAKLVIAYEEKAIELHNTQVLMAQKHNLSFPDISLSLCTSFVSGFIASKSFYEGNYKHINKATNMLTVAYCQDIETESEFKNIKVDIINSQGPRKLIDIITEPPLVIITPSGYRKYMENQNQ